MLTVERKGESVGGGEGVNDGGEVGREMKNQ